MISITIIPELFRLAKLSVGDITIEYDDFMDKLTLRGIVSTTDERLDELDKPELIVDFMDIEGESLYIGSPILHGKFTEFGFCPFSICIMNVSSIMETEEISEIRITPN